MLLTLTLAMGVHPRACGENEAGGEVPVPVEGPSPRLRGKPRQPGLCPGAERSIPAPAGKTIVSAVVCGPGGVHPRACGENLATPTPPRE